MKKVLSLVMFLWCTFASGQHTISGTFSPAGDFTWLIAYRLGPNHQNYVADTAITNGNLNLKIPENSRPGTYRMVYGVPQDEFYFDVIYNGKEDIELNFKLGESPSFIASKENILYSIYFQEIYEAKQELVDFYVLKKEDTNEYFELLKKLRIVQEDYEKKSSGLLSEHFIKANKPYIPETYEEAEQYIQNKRKNYFKSLDFKDSILQGSEFLESKLVGYVFTALPPRELSDSEMESAIRDNIKIAAEQIQEVSKSYQFNLFDTLQQYASSNGLESISDFLLENYMNITATTKEEIERLDQIKAEKRTSIGETAPEIEWMSKQGQKKLTTLEGGAHYILVFWSSTCSHCLNELPALHEELKDSKNIKVVAIGLEDDDRYWKLESEKLGSFEHAIAVGKWESDYAKLYDIHKTPTYFILDSKKRIVAKPENYQEVIDFLSD